MEAKLSLGNADDGKEWFFRGGKFELSTSPINSAPADFEAALEARGYQRLAKFGREFCFGVEILQSTMNDYLVSIEYEDSTIQFIWIDSFADYMEFMRQFGHLATLAEASATRTYVEDAHDLVLDRNWGILREGVRTVADRRRAVEKPTATK